MPLFMVILLRSIGSTDSGAVAHALSSNKAKRVSVVFMMRPKMSG
jgi:hypothetical protein